MTTGPIEDSRKVYRELAEVSGAGVPFLRVELCHGEHLMSMTPPACISPSHNDFIVAAAAAPGPSRPVWLLLHVIGQGKSFGIYRDLSPDILFARQCGAPTL